jgi:hypothetical protein
VDQVVGDVGPFQGGPERLGLEHVGLDYLATGLTQIVRALGVARQRSYFLAFVTEAPAEEAADIPGRTSDRDH